MVDVEQSLNFLRNNYGDTTTNKFIDQFMGYHDYLDLEKIIIMACKQDNVLNEVFESAYKDFREDNPTDEEIQQMEQDQIEDRQYLMQLWERSR